MNRRTVSRPNLRVTSLALKTDLSQSPWGTVKTLDEGPGYKIRRLEIEPGQGVSLQLQDYSMIHWLIVAGIAKITLGNQKLLLSTNQSSFLPRQTLYRLDNPGTIPLTLMEVQNGGFDQEGTGLQPGMFPWRTA